MSWEACLPLCGFSNHQVLLGSSVRSLLFCDHPQTQENFPEHRPFSTLPISSHSPMHPSPLLCLSRSGFGFGATSLTLMPRSLLCAASLTPKSIPLQSQHRGCLRIPSLCICTEMSCKKLKQLITFPNKPASLPLPPLSTSHQSRHLDYYLWKSPLVPSLFPHISYFSLIFGPFLLTYSSSYSHYCTSTIPTPFLSNSTLLQVSFLNVNLTHLFNISPSGRVEPPYHVPPSLL